MVKPQHSNNGFFYRFKKSLLEFLKLEKSPNEEDIDLAQEVQRNADEVLIQLRAIKNDLKHTVDGKLFTHVEDVVDPLAARIQSITKKLGTGKADIQEFDHWINKKVRPFVESFSAKTDDKKAIEKAILKHMIEVCTKQIDVDLKVVRDDQHHKLMSLNIEEEERLSLSLRVEEALAPIIQRWTELRIPPKRLSLENVNVWKKEVDQHRNQYYQTAMDLIDTLIPDFDQTEEMHESLLANFKKIEDLEISLPPLLHNLRDEEFISNNLARLTKKLGELVEEAHHLELDLQLTPELFKRLQKVKASLNYASNLLSHHQD